MKFIITACLSLTIGTGFAQNLYGDMETWRNVPVMIAPSAGIEMPVNWYATDSIIFMAGYIYPQAHFHRQTYKSLDAHNGNYAVKLITIRQDSLGLLPAMFTNTNISVDQSVSDPAQSLTFTGGTPVTQQIASITAWVKYFPIGNDTASISVNAVIATPGFPDTILSTNKIPIIGRDSLWTRIVVPLTYTNSQIPNQLRIWISSGSLSAVQDSSTLFVDDVSFAALGINTVTTNDNAFILYPNPCHKYLRIKINNGNGTIRITDILGRLQMTAYITNTGQIDVSDFSAGIYFVSMLNKDGTIHSASFSVEK